MKRMIESFAYHCLYIVLYAASLLPMWLLYRMASAVFYLTYYVAGYRKAVVIQNLSRSFPGKKYAEIRCIMKQFYVGFTNYFAEIVKSISAPVTMLDTRVKFENLELLNRNMNAGRNVIVCLGHCGNWELLHFLPHKLPHSVYAIYKPLRSGVINRLMLKLRSRFGMQLIADKSVVRHIRSKQSAPAVYLFLADQCPPTQDEQYKFELLNQETYVFSGMEKLARLSGSAVVYLNITQPSKGHYTITCMPICSQATSVEEGTITQTYIHLLTENIHEEPYGWLWTHKRWKR